MIFKNKIILFQKRYKRLTGGHLKTYDYFNHVCFSKIFSPRVYFTEESTINKNDPWNNIKHKFILNNNNIKPDVLFLDGMDWNFLTEEQKLDISIPKINLIQHIRHADPENERFNFLKYKAIRICVSKEIYNNLKSLNIVNGPLFVIPNCLDFSSFPKPLKYSEKDIDVSISALKHPKLGNIINEKLKNLGYKTVLLDSFIPRNKYLGILNKSKISVFLPNKLEGEGYYLPALEGMILKTIVICPDCIGNREFCIPDYNCIQPQYNTKGIINSVLKASKLNEIKKKSLLKGCKETILKYRIKNERKSFLKILNNLDSIWNN